MQGHVPIFFFSLQLSSIIIAKSFLLLNSGTVETDSATRDSFGFIYRERCEKKRTETMLAELPLRLAIAHRGGRRAAKVSESWKFFSSG